ncbi:hypothetical protein DFH94DRAFT_678475 [Russula ochroleuca]|uniref:Uncharacterized protein n=1 Tax=Russula ochroleuca TaxID=152965 RepID=A0A9P5N713_9AGAM|nr:hypothetical protein DFH94DRAFT_678475 [Russula ochroleuca]
MSRTSYATPSTLITGLLLPTVSTRLSAFLTKERIYAANSSYPTCAHLVEVIKPDWGALDPSAVSSKPDLRATWLGHSPRSDRPLQLTGAHQCYFVEFSASSFFLTAVKIGADSLLLYALPVQRTLTGTCKGLQLNTQFPTLVISEFDNPATPKIRLGSARKFSYCRMRVYLVARFPWVAAGDYSLWCPIGVLPNRRATETAGADCALMRLSTPVLSPRYNFLPSPTTCHITAAFRPNL